jgi:DNA modification methylase
MNHEYLNGDAMKEIIKDGSIDLFIMYPPFLGIDIQRYSNPDGQINKINDPYIFAKKLGKMIKNCEKALKDNGNIALILPVHDPLLLGLVAKRVSKKTKLQYNGTIIWDYRNPQYSVTDRISGEYCHIMWLSKGAPKVDQNYIMIKPEGIFSIPLDPDYLVEKYGQMGHVYDAMPEQVAEHLIKWFTLPGDTVADVMGGTGTVSIAAENTGRDSVYNDVSYVQLTIAKKRMEDLIASKKKSSLKVDEQNQISD